VGALEQHIGGLQVAVHHAHAVQVGHAARHLGSSKKGGGRRGDLQSCASAHRSAQGACRSAGPSWVAHYRLQHTPQATP
jgi:hypothetical protein